MILLQNNKSLHINIDFSFSNIYQLLSVIIICLIFIANIFTMIVVIIGKLRGRLIIKLQNCQYIIASTITLVGLLFKALKVDNCSLILSLEHLGILSVNTSCIFIVLVNNVMITQQSVILNNKSRICLIVSSLLGNWLPSITVAILIYVFRLNTTDDQHCKLQPMYTHLFTGFYAVIVIIVILLIIEMNHVIKALKKKSFGANMPGSFKYKKRIVLYVIGIIVYFLSMLLLILYPNFNYNDKGSEIYLIVFCVISLGLTYIYVWNGMFLVELKGICCKRCCYMKEFGDAEESIHDYFKEDDGSFGSKMKENK